MLNNFWNEHEIEVGMDQLIEICLDIQDCCKWMENNLSATCNYSCNWLFRCVVCKLCNDLYDLWFSEKQKDINSFNYVFEKTASNSKVLVIKKYFDTRHIPLNVSPCLGRKLKEDLKISEMEYRNIKNWVSGHKHGYVLNKSPLLRITQNNKTIAPGVIVGNFVDMIDVRNFCDFTRAICQLIFRSLRPDADIHMERM